MHSDKKKTKEDTWNTDDLRKHIMGEAYTEEVYVRRPKDYARKHRGGDSVERSKEDSKKELRRKREKYQESESAWESVKPKEREKERHFDERKEVSRNRAGERDERHKEKRRERDGFGESSRYKETERESKERSHDRERKENRDKEKTRERDKEKTRTRERDRGEDRERSKGREEKDGSEKIKDKEHRVEKDRKRDKKKGEEGRDRERLHFGERKDRHRERKYVNETESQKHKLQDHDTDKERRERDKDKVHARQHEDREEREKKKQVKEKEKEISYRDEYQDVKNEEAVTEDEDSGDYEEDFEVSREEIKRERLFDYEEDFDDESAEEDEDLKEKQRCEEVKDIKPKRNGEIEAIQKAINEENARVGTALSRPDTDEDQRPKTTKSPNLFQSPGPQHGKFIDFVAAKHREVNRKVCDKQKKRSTELLRLIDLDFSMTFSLLDLPPVNEYDMYIKSFGTTNTKQAYVQCNEDNVDRDIQTEETETCEMWTQHPAERNGACGGLAREIQDVFKSQLIVDSQRLAKFLHCASRVVTVLMEEDHAEKQSLKKLRSQVDTLSFSEGCLQLNTKLPFLHGRQICLVHFSEVQKQTMLSVHSPSSKPSAVRLDSKSIICIWNIWEPSQPQKILVYESEVRCCCFSPGKATLVFAGTTVGSVVLWDLREHASSHYSLSIGDSNWTLRHPTFSTDSVLAFSGHMSSVCSVETFPTTSAGELRPQLPMLAFDEESSGLSFQLASLDENGVLHLWVVLELPSANDSGSQTELGLRPGGKVKLLHSSSVLTIERNLPLDAIKTGLPQALLLKFHPTDTSHFFIGTNMSLVSHGTIHGLKAHPKFYRPQVVGARPVDVTSIQFSALLFLVGCGDGSIRLHTVGSEQPIMEWSDSTACEPVASVQWSQTSHTLFFVLDAASSLYLWDLLENEFEPVSTEKNTIDRITTMAVFGDRENQNTYSGIALARKSGKIELQYFTKKLTVPNSESLGKLESMMNETF